MGVVGAALRGFGKALAKKGDGKAIKSVPIAKNLTRKRQILSRVLKLIFATIRKDSSQSWI